MNILKQTIAQGVTAWNTLRVLFCYTQACTKSDKGSHYANSEETVLRMQVKDVSIKQLFPLNTQENSHSITAEL